MCCLFLCTDASTANSESFMLFMASPNNRRDGWKCRNISNVLEVGLEFFMNFKIYGTEKLFIIKRAIKIDKKKMKTFREQQFSVEKYFSVFFPPLRFAHCFAHIWNSRRCWANHTLGKICWRFRSLCIPGMRRKKKKVKLVAGWEKFMQCYSSANKILVGWKP